MQKLKEMIEQIVTGIKKKSGLYGSFAGKYQLAAIIYFKN
jgi:hypothetical protein